MCGILGQISFTRPVGEARPAFEGALDRQAHRGPDDRGVAVLRRGLLGHRRLSILDLDPRARQPMSTESGGSTIVFNGEIYNFRELRQDLVAHGCRFRTTGDTEVLLQGLERHGPDFVDRCLGMFAFALYDAGRDVLHLVRDRLGIKPLYYCLVDGVLSFSSSIESLLALPAIPRELNERAVSSYLSYRYPIGNETFFKHIRELAPGHRLEFDARGVRIGQYWDLPRDTRADGPPASALQRLRQLKKAVHSAVRYRLIADVPVGAYLSGGLDSSVLVAVMSRYAGSPVRTFTIGFEAEGYNEFAEAREVAEKCGTLHTEIVQDAGAYFGLMEQLIERKGAPLAVPNEVPLWSLSTELKKAVTVVLSGEGADESFCGYGRIFRSPFDFERSMPGYPWRSESTRQAFTARWADRYGQRRFASRCAHFLDRYRYTTPSQKRELLAEDFPVDALEQSLDAEFESLFDATPEQEYERQLGRVFLKVHLPGLLQRLDNATMAASVEGRVPFVDHRLVELAWALPTECKLHWRSAGARDEAEALLADDISERYDVTKYALRKAFERELGEGVVTRTKVGFPVPLHRWHEAGVQEMVTDYLLDETARRRGLYNTAGIQRWLASPETRSSHARAMKLWMLLNLEVFQRKFFDTSNRAAQ